MRRIKTQLKKMKFVKHILITEALRITNGRSRRSKGQTQYANATAEQAAKDLASLRDQITMQILWALKGNVCRNQQSGTALNGYIGSTLISVILSVMSYQKNGKPAKYHNINRYLLNNPPTKEQVEQILKNYLAGYDTEVQTMLSNLKGYAAQNK